MQVKVQVFILARDRPGFLKEAIDSVLAQQIADVEIVVSDNSEHDEVESLIAASYPQLKYVRRVPALEIDQHFNAIVRESVADYVVYFHDDDVMAPDYLTKMSAALDADPDVVAVACNAWTILDNERSNQARMGGGFSSRRVSSAEELLEYYLDFTNTLLAPPHPSYMYRLEYARGVFGCLSEAGIYGDVPSLMRLVSRGPILWLGEPLIWYREHGKNLSSREDVGSRLKLLRYIFNNSAIDRHARMVTAYRFRFWLNWWRTGKCSGRATPWRNRIVGRFLVSTAMRFALTHPGYWAKLHARMRRAFSFVRAA